MKIGHIVKLSLCAWLSVLGAGCHQVKAQSTSRFGTGHFYCLYQDVRNGRFFKASAEKEHRAVRLARNACKQSMPRELYYQYCDFVACRFK